MGAAGGGLESVQRGVERRTVAGLYCRKAPSGGPGHGWASLAGRPGSSIGWARNTRRYSTSRSRNTRHWHEKVQGNPFLATVCGAAERCRTSASQLGTRHQGMTIPVCRAVTSVRQPVRPADVSRRRLWQTMAAVGAALLILQPLLEAAGELPKGREQPGSWPVPRQNRVSHQHSAAGGTDGRGAEDRGRDRLCPGSGCSHWLCRPSRMGRWIGPLSSGTGGCAAIGSMGRCFGKRIRRA